MLCLVCYSSLDRTSNLFCRLICRIHNHCRRHQMTWGCFSSKSALHPCFWNPASYPGPTWFPVQQWCRLFKRSQLMLWNLRGHTKSYVSCIPFKGFSTCSGSYSEMLKGTPSATQLFTTAEETWQMVLILFSVYNPRSLLCNMQSWIWHSIAKKASSG